MLKKRVFTVILLMTSLLMGCSDGTVKNTDKELKVSTTELYPIKSDEKLTYWVALNPNVSAYAKSLNETPFAQELIKKTGIHVEYIHPPIGQETEQFNSMMAANNLPDMVEADWYSYAEGPDKAIEQNTIIGLNTVMDSFCPNLKNVFEKKPDISKLIKTDKGSYYMFPFIRDDEILSTYMGGMIRKDLLDKIGQPIPETIDEWETVLKLCKKNSVKIPITIRLDNYYLSVENPFIGAFGISGGFYIDADKVKFGPYEPEYKNFIQLMNRWYNEGLLDKEFANGEDKRLSSIITNGQAGAAFGAAGREFGEWIPALKDKIPEAEFVPFKYPVISKGEKAKFGQKDLPVLNTGVAISGQSKNVELAARFLDYGYSEPGHMLYNFGIEGVSYDIKEGEPYYSDNITDRNKNGNLSIGQAMSKYMRACYNGPFIQDKKYIFQYYSMDVQKKALNIWSDTETLRHKIPYVSLTSEENKEYSRIIKNIDAYRQEMLFKMITGKESLVEFDKYISALKSMGIEKAIAIQQAAYDRYKKR